MTQLYVDKLKPRDDPFRVWDVTQRGLVLTVRPTGAKSWKAIYAVHGRPRWFHIGRADAVALAAARKIAGRVMVEVAEGGDPQAERRAKRSAGTFDDLADRYIDQFAKKHNRSWKQADALVRNHLRPRWGKIPPADISRADVRSAIRSIDSPTTANQTLAAASAIFSWAIREEVGSVIANPCRGVDRHPTVSRDRVLSASEISSFWTAFDDVGLVRGTALKLLLLLGQRPGEIAHLRHEMIVDGWWEMPGRPVPELEWPGTKNSMSHRVWLPHAARALLAELGGTQGFVFPGDRGGAVKGLSGAMRDICENLGAERATPHDLRRTNGTIITMLGFGRDAMNRIQNHREGGIADTYDRHGYAEENKRVMEAVAAHIVAQATGEAAPSNVTRLRLPKPA